MKYSTQSCSDPQYRKTILARHRFPVPDFTTAISTFWQGNVVMENVVTSAQMIQLLEQAIPGESLLLCTGSPHCLNDMSFSLLLQPEPDKMIPSEALPIGAFAGVYSYDLFFAVLTDYQPDKFVFYKATTAGNSRSVIFKAVKHNQDVYLADAMNDIP